MQHSKFFYEEIEWTSMHKDSFFWRWKYQINNYKRFHLKIFENTNNAKND